MFPILFSQSPITYNALVIADVTLGGQSYPGALVYLSFAADTRTVFPFFNANSYGYVNPIGYASVTVVSGHRVLRAGFAPFQLYAFFDIKNSNAGFGSFAGGPGYPLSLTATQPSGGFYNFANSTLGAVSDILRTPADVNLYSPLTQTLLTNLTNSTTLSGNASSCRSLDPTTAICSNLTPTSLSTSLGSFTITEPYTDDVSGTGAQPYSANFGIFWAEKRSRLDH